MLNLNGVQLTSLSQQNSPVFVLLDPAALLLVSTFGQLRKDTVHLAVNVKPHRKQRVLISRGLSNTGKNPLPSAQLVFQPFRKQKKSHCLLGATGTQISRGCKLLVHDLVTCESNSLGTWLVTFSRQSSLVTFSRRSAFFETIFLFLIQWQAVTIQSILAEVLTLIM